MTIAFDTLKFADRLAAGGFTDAQAKTAAAALSDAFTETAVNKADLDQAVRRLDTKMEAVRADLSHAIGKLDAKLDRTAERLDAKIDASDARMTVKLGAMLAVAVGRIGVLVKLLH